MNKRKVEEYIPVAIKALKNENLKIAKNGKIEKTFRGAISTFGAAITMGSFRAAVAFFSDKGSSTIERTELIKALYFITKGQWKEAKDIFDEVSDLKGKSMDEMKEDFINASVALKLAMNSFDLV
ncbi:MAG: hypothetical protein K6G90_05730 [Clostridia bacterium]|nr:hypothetical protein [Clostridia bacterium]